LSAARGVSPADFDGTRQQPEKSPRADGLNLAGKLRKEQQNLTIIMAQLRGKCVPIKSLKDTPSTNTTYKNAIGETKRQANRTDEPRPAPLTAGKTTPPKNL
jgi:hypothetical protein